jgi:hypothetical protein
MTEPKPCPICGSDDFATEFDETDDGMVTAVVECMGCDEDVTTRGPTSKPCETYEAAEEAAIRAWNEHGPVTA